MLRVVAFVCCVVCLASCTKDKTPTQSVPTEFEITYPQSGSQLANAILSADNGLFVLGKTETGSVSNLQLTKLGFAGNVIWNRTYSDALVGAKLITTSDNNLLLVGTTATTTNGNNIFLTKLDFSGNLIWQQNFGGSLAEFGSGLIELPDNSILLVGTTQTFGLGATSMYVIKTDANGNELWSRTFGGLGLDGGTDIVEMSSNQFLLLGYTSSFGAGDRDLYIQTISMDGDSLASITIGGAGYEESQAISKTLNGGFIMSNHSASNEPNHQLLATKLNANLQSEWEQEFGSITEHEGGEAVLADSEGNYVFVGRTNGFGNEEQVYFVKTDPAGTILEELNFGNTGNQRGNSITEHNDSYYICGTSTVNDDSDILIIKHPK